MIRSLNPSQPKKLLPNQLFQLYRNRANLTQQEVAQLVNLKSYQAVGFWEEGRSLPRAVNLKNLLKNYLFRGVFTPNRELTEAFELWSSVKDLQDAKLDITTPYPDFDEQWFNALLREYNPTDPSATFNNIRTFQHSKPSEADSGDKPIAPNNTLPGEATLVWPNNLHKPLTSLVGRQTELSALYAYLARPEVRLLTLNGPGGSGKTRLATELGNTLPRPLQSQFKDGAFFVDLSSIYDPESVLFTIAQTLGLNETEANQPVIKLLKNYLLNRKILLILDNFEQIIRAAPLVTSLLAETNFLKIVVTSREILRCGGEHSFEVLPLILPDDRLIFKVEAATRQSSTGWLTLGSSVENMAQVPAVALFVQRAQAIRNGFKLTAENCQAVAKLCRCLDGLPLTIELACYHLKTFTPQQLLLRLQQPLEVLENEDSGSAIHHQTLRKTLDWSYNLLTPAEQNLFSQVAVFPASFTLEALEAIVQSEPTLKVWKILEALINKSLISRIETPLPSNPSDRVAFVRFRLLNTIRDYALEQLQKSEQEAGLRKRHAVYYAELTETASANLVEAVPGLESRQLELELDNLRAALNWSRETKNIELHYRLLGELWRFWRFWGLISEGRRYLESGLTEITPTQLANDSSLNRPWLSSYLETLYGAGILAIRQHDYIKATTHLEQGLTVATKADNTSAIAKFLCAIGELNRRQAFYEAALTYYQQSLELYARLADRNGIGTVYHNLGALAIVQNNKELARHYCEQALAIWEEQNNKLGITGTNNILAEIALAEGNYHKARLYCERSLAVKSELGDKTGKARLFIILGYVYLNARNYREASELFWNSLELLEMMGDKADLARCLNGLGFLSLARGEQEQARTFFLQSLDLKQKESMPGDLIGLAIWLKQQGEIVQATQLTGTIQKLIENQENNLIEFHNHEYELILRVLAEMKPGE